MNAGRIRIAMICGLALGSGVASGAPANQPCEQLRTACENVGFAQGAATKGSGLWMDCVLPLMRGHPQRPQATKPLPEVSPEIVTACHAHNPDFGSPAVHDERPAPPLTITFTAAKNDQALHTPSGMTIIPDEHTTIMPVARTDPPSYLFFVATNNTGFDVGAAALESSDLIHFNAAPGFGNADHGGLVMWSPSGFQDCHYSGAPVFDQNYAAPGSVVRDPTLPEGNLIMLYEAERHCPGGGGSAPEFNYWAAVGLARSSDGGKTWPAPGHYGNERYAALQIPGTEPSTPHADFGDALPSAFVDDVKSEKADHYLYVVYYFNGTPATRPDGFMRVARARLGGSGKLEFKKWYVDPTTKKGGFTQDGSGGADSAFTPSVGCAEPSYQINGEINYDDALGLYMLTFVCTTMQRQTDGSYKRIEAGWYFSTATSLETQNWTSPQLIVNSAAPTKDDWNWNGWYPSFMSPGCEAGHLGLSGTVFFLAGSPVGARTFQSRAFTIDAAERKSGGGCGQRAHFSQ